MSKQLKVNVLSKKSIDLAIKQIEAYKRNLIYRCNQFVEKMAELGLSEAHYSMQNARGDSELPNFETTAIQIDNNKVRIAIRMTGKDILFWEFGAGIYYNRNNENPKQDEFGMGVGTYPGQKNAFNPDGWWYKKNGEWVHSLGTKAMMPMYNADIRMISDIERIAKEVFNV